MKFKKAMELVQFNQDVKKLVTENRKGRKAKKKFHEEALSAHYDTLTTKQRKTVRMQLFIKQNGACAICGQPESELNKRLSLDHCHLTGHIRGLLCVRCNFFIGAAKDNAHILRAAIDYLTKNREKEFI